MLSRSLTSCLIKPIANDFVFVINSICSLKRSVHTEGYTPLGATRGLSRYMEMAVYGVFPHSRVGSCGFQGNGWLTDHSIQTAHVCLLFSNREKRKQCNLSTN